MFNKENIEIADDDLPREEDNGLHALAEGGWYYSTSFDMLLPSWSGGPVGDDDGGHNGCDYPCHAPSVVEKEERSAKLHQHFQHEIDSQASEVAESLQHAAPDTQRYVDCSSHSEQNNVA